MTAADENMSIQCKKGCLVIEMLSFSYAWCSTLKQLSQGTRQKTKWR